MPNLTFIPATSLSYEHLKLMESTPIYRTLLGYLNLIVLDFFVRQLLDSRATIDQLSSAVARRLKQA